MIGDRNIQGKSNIPISWVAAPATGICKFSHFTKIEYSNFHNYAKLENMWDFFPMEIIFPPGHKKLTKWKWRGKEKEINQFLRQRVCSLQSGERRGAAKAAQCCKTLQNVAKTAKSCRSLQRLQKAGKAAEDCKRLQKVVEGCNLQLR